MSVDNVFIDFFIAVSFQMKNTESDLLFKKMNNDEGQEQRDKKNIIGLPSITRFFENESWESYF